LGALQALRAIAHAPIAWGADTGDVMASYSMTPLKAACLRHRAALGDITYEGFRLAGWQLAPKFKIFVTAAREK